MPRVSVLARDEAVVFVGPGQSETRIAVTYITALFPPRTVNLPPALYREAEPDELAANRRLAWRLKDDAARDAERQAIADDIVRQRSAQPETFEIP